MGQPQIRDLADRDRPWLRELIASLWGLPLVTPAGIYQNPELLDGLVAELQGTTVGALTFHVDGPEWEVVTVNSVRPGMGAGRAMLDHLHRQAERTRATRIWLITTDENPAVEFYNHIGMQRSRVHSHFIEIVRRAKPTMPPNAFSDAIEFEWLINPP